MLLGQGRACGIGVGVSLILCPWDSLPWRPGVTERLYYYRRHVSFIFLDALVSGNSSWVMVRGYVLLPRASSFYCPRCSWVRVYDYRGRPLCSHGAEVTFGTENRLPLCHLESKLSRAVVVKYGSVVVRCKKDAHEVMFYPFIH